MAQSKASGGKLRASLQGAKTTYGLQRSTITFPFRIRTTSSSSRLVSPSDSRQSIHCLCVPTDLRDPQQWREHLEGTMAPMSSSANMQRGEKCALKGSQEMARRKWQPSKARVHSLCILNPSQSVLRPPVSHFSSCLCGSSVHISSICFSSCPFSILGDGFLSSRVCLSVCFSVAQPFTLITP